MTEPILTRDDEEVWNDWMDVCEAWSRSRLHLARVDEARSLISSFIDQCPDSYVSWSAGKDSTALAVLAAEVSPGIMAISIKDDLDYPGEEEYISGIAGEHGIDLRILRPSFSLQEWIRDNAVDVTEDVHSRASEFSRTAFYGIVDSIESSGYMLGLRVEESRGRAINLRWRGPIYKKAGRIVGCPLANWESRDVYAFLISRRVEPLHVYRCVRFNADDPGRVRKSWWIGGSESRVGAMVWLRSYYPSLFRRLGEICTVRDIRTAS